VLDLVSQVRDVILMNVYLDLGNSGGSGFWNGGYMTQGREMGSQFMSNLGTRWTDPITARRVQVRKEAANGEQKGMEKSKKQGDYSGLIVICILVHSECL
jgi:hypothetical protein